MADAQALLAKYRFETLVDFCLRNFDVTLRDRTPSEGGAHNPVDLLGSVRDNALDRTCPDQSFWRARRRHRDEANRPGSSPTNDRGRCPLTAPEPRRRFTLGIPSSRFEPALGVATLSGVAGTKVSVTHATFAAP